MSSLANFRLRLYHANQAKMLPARSQYNLAALNTDDDTHEWAIAQTGGPAYGQSGFGWSEIFNELMSRDPKYVPVTDIQTMQTRLQSQGYVSGVEPDGNWSLVWAAGSRRSDRDSMDLVRAGKHFAAVPVKKFFEYMQYTLPTPILEGVFGAAKGVVKDAQRALTNPKEVAEEGGAFGTAAVGAGTGAIVGSVVPGFGTGIGALVGGGIGLAAGFFGGLFDDDEEEEGNWERIIDALTPIEEIASGDAKNFFSALSTVMTASGFLKAGSLAVGGTRAALAAPAVTGGRAAGGIVVPTLTAAREAGLREAFRRAAVGTVEPGLAGSILRSAARRPVLGGAVTGSIIDAAPDLLEGDFGEAAISAVRGAAVGGFTGAGFKRIPRLQQAAIGGLSKAPLQRAMQAPAGRILKSLYTGTSTAGISGRIAAELPGTAVGEEIEEAKGKFGGVHKPGLDVGDVLDWTVGSVLYPSRLLPFRFREAGAAIEAMGSKNALYPFAKAAMRTRDDAGKRVTRSLKESFGHVEQVIGRHPVDGTRDPVTLATRVEFAYLNKGLDDRARDGIRVREREKGDPFVRKFAQQKRFEEKRGSLVEKMYSEAQGDDLARSPLAKEILEESLSNPTRMQSEIQDWEGGGSLIDQFASHQQADELLQARTLEEVAETGKAVAFTPAVKGQFLTKQEVIGLKDSYRTAADDYAAAQKAALELPNNTVLRDEQNRAAQVLDDTVLQLKRRELIDEGDFNSFRASSGQLDMPDNKRLLKRLDEIAKLRPAENETLTQELAAKGLDRYIAVNTGPNLLHYGKGKLMEVAGMAEFAKRRPFFDALSDVFSKIDDKDLGSLRDQNIAAELDQFAPQLGAADGKSIAGDIYNSIRGRYDVDVARSQGFDLSVKRGGRVSRTERATGIETKEWFKIDPRDLRPDDLVEALPALQNLDDPLQVANDIKAALHRGAAFGADVMHPIRTARALGSNLRVAGLPGFNDYMRTARVRLDKLPTAGKWAKEGSYGYIPHNLRRAHMAVQFSLSPTFDASRYVEAMSFGVAKGMLPPRLALWPAKTIMERDSISPFDGQMVSGREAVQQMHMLADDVLYQRPAMQGFDELQFRLLNAGALGFKPKEVEAAQTWMLAQKRLKAGQTLDRNAREEIRETVLEINRYGKGQTGFAKSLHFVFFPYLFQAKQLRALEGFILGAPTRNLLVTEGFRRWYGVNGDEGLSESFNRSVEKHLPIAKELERLNNLSYGIGPGRFFLEGMLDKSTEGKVAQGLQSFFLPGGVHQPVAEAAGGVTDTFKQFFVPQVWSNGEGERLGTFERMRDIAERLIPAYRDVERWFLDNEQQLLTAQGIAITEGETPNAQYEDYTNIKRVMDVGLEGVAQSLGYSSVDSLRQSQHGPVISDFTEAMEATLSTSYPTGAEIATRFRDWDSVKGQFLTAIAAKDDPTDAERAIQFIGVLEDQAKALAAQTGRTQDDVLKLVTPMIRSYALANVKDRQFIDLYETLFEFDFGPVREVAA